ncbi:MAG: CPBP family intramembrane glutamic endopeptidase [Myxococcota bacterium]
MDRDLPDSPEAGWSRSALVLTLYGGLTLAAFVWRAALGDPNALLHPRVDARFTPIAPLAGLATGLAFVGLSRFAVVRLAWARRLHGEFRAVLGPLDGREILLIALASSIGEECFFRGAMLPTLGLAASSAIFALLHVGPGWRYLPWTASALVMGLITGVAFEHFGELSSPIVAHFTINYLNLRHIVATDVGPLAAAPAKHSG